MRTYADVYAVVQQHMSWLTLCMLTYADVCGRMLTYAGVCCGAATHELAYAVPRGCDFEQLLD
jgi:hypothetical protein